MIAASPLPLVPIVAGAIAAVAEACRSAGFSPNASARLDASAPLYWSFMEYSFRHSMCNEAFEKRHFADTVRAIRRAGYRGIEIAPFTLAESPAVISPDRRREYRAAMADAGLTFAGLHWLLASPPGLHVTTPDPSLWRRSWDYVRRLIDLCADLGPDGMMVFGSPRQRSSTGGIGRAEATRHFAAGLASIASHAEARAVTVLVEALPAAQSDVVQSLQEAVTIVHQIASPAIRTMFDVHNAVDEPEPHSALIDRYFDEIRHVHVNELDGRHCGTGGYDFAPLFAVLARRGYGGWISLEAFDFSYGGDRIAAESLAFLESVIAKIS